MYEHTGLNLVRNEVMTKVMGELVKWGFFSIPSFKMIFESKWSPHRTSALFVFFEKFIKNVAGKFFGTYEDSHSAVCCCLVRKHKAAYLASGQLGGLIFRSPYLITSHPHLHHCVNSIIWSPIGFGRCCTFTLHSLLAHEGSVQLLCPDDLEIGSTEKKS